MLFIFAWKLAPQYNLQSKLFSATKRRMRRWRHLVVRVGQLLKSEGENMERTKEQMYFFVVTLVTRELSVTDLGQDQKEKT